MPKVTVAVSKAKLNPEASDTFTWSRFGPMLENVYAQNGSLVWAILKPFKYQL